MATESIPMAPPVAERPGPIGWMRRNLFATPFDTALTLLVIVVLALIVPPLFRWAVLNASLTATNRTECPVDGACWALIPSRIHHTFNADNPRRPVEQNGVPLSLLIAAGRPTSRNTRSKILRVSAVRTDGRAAQASR